MKKIEIEVPEWDDIPVPYKHDPDFLAEFYEFEQHRKKIKKPMTEYAKVRWLKKMVLWTKEEAIHHIGYSIDKAYLGIFKDPEYVKKTHHVY